MRLRRLSAVSRHAAIMIGLLGGLSGCALFSPQPENGPAATQQGDFEHFEQRRQVLQSINSWSLQARVATGQIVGWSGNLRWRQQGPRHDLIIGGPLGGGLRATGDDRRTVITTADGSFETTDPEGYFEQEIGWRFPLRQLRYWALGIPDPRLAAQQFSSDEYGRATGFRQAGWSVSYESYADVQGLQLPAAMVLSDGDRQVRVLIDRWVQIG